MSDLREAGIDVVNDLGFSRVRIERPAMASGYQFFKVTSDRSTFNFYVTPKGYLRVEQPRTVSRSKAKEAQGG